jgi:hypothetical protein
MIKYVLSEMINIKSGIQCKKGITMQIKHFLGIGMIIAIILGCLWAFFTPKTTLSATLYTDSKQIIPANQPYRITFRGNNGQTTWISLSDPERQSGEVVGSPGGQLYIGKPGGTQHLLGQFAKGTQDIHVEYKWYEQDDKIVVENLSGFEGNTVDTLKFDLTHIE